MRLSRQFLLRACGSTATAILVFGATLSGSAPHAAASGAAFAALGCAASGVPGDISFPSAFGGIAAGALATGPAMLAVTNPGSSVVCGVVLQDSTPDADNNPNTVDGGTITFTLSTGNAATTAVTGQPIASILESNGSSYSVSCGSAGVDSCQGAVAGGAGIMPSGGNTVHVALGANASFPLIGGASPVILLTATYQRFGGGGGASASTTIGLLLPTYTMTLGAAPATTPAASGGGQGTTLTAALFHTATTNCAGTAGLVVPVTGGFTLCGAAAGVLQNAAGAESGMVTFTTSSGTFGSTSATPGTSGQQTYTVHCGQVPNTAPNVALPTLGLPLNLTFTACQSATAVLYGGGNSGTAQVTANYVADFSGQTAQATATVQLSPTPSTANLTPGCNEVVTPASTAAGATVAAVAGTVTPGGIVLSAWQFNNGLHAFQAGYFAVAGAPTDFSTIGPGQSIFVCVSGAGAFPT